MQTKGSTDAGEVRVVTAEERELTPLMVQFLTDTAHQRIGQIDGCAMGGEEQTVVHLLHTADPAPLFLSQLMTEGRHRLTLIALQHHRVGHAVGQCVAAFHPRLVTLLQYELCIAIPEVRRIVPGSRRMRHIDHLLHQRQRGLYTLHPRLRPAVHRIDLGHDLLAVLLVHLRKLRGEHRVHLILVVLVLDLHIGKRQESGREILGCGEGALAGIGIEQHLAAHRTAVVRQQPLGYHPLAEELPHLRLQRSAAQRQLTAWRRPLKPFIRCHPHICRPS